MSCKLGLIGDGSSNHLRLRRFSLSQQKEYLTLLSHSNLFFQPYRSFAAYDLLVKRDLQRDFEDSIRSVTDFAWIWTGENGYKREATEIGHHHEHHKSEEDKRREHLASLTADSDVRAPGIRQRIKEEVQAIYQSIHDKLCLPKKQKIEE